MAINLGAGNDKFPGPGQNNAGDDDVQGGTGNDTLRGDGGFDTLRGDGGKDKIYGGADNDNLFGGADNDYLNSGTGNFDDVTPGGGADRIDFNKFTDISNVQPDVATARASDDGDFIFDFSGNDTIDFSDINGLHGPVLKEPASVPNGRVGLFDEGDNVDVVVHDGGNKYYVLTAFDTNVNEVFDNLIV
jgi:Ca2+-binding RTX toxin-like protein